MRPIRPGSGTSAIEHSLERGSCAAATLQIDASWSFVATRCLQQLAAGSKDGKAALLLPPRGKRYPKSVESVRGLYPTRRVCSNCSSGIALVFTVATHNFGGVPGARATLIFSLVAPTLQPWSLTSLRTLRYRSNCPRIDLCRSLDPRTKDWRFCGTFRRARGPKKRFSLTSTPTMACWALPPWLWPRIHS